MNTTERTRMYERITQHGRNLIALFGLPADTDPVKLAKRLRRLEVEAERVTTDYANGATDEFAAGDRLTNIAQRAARIVGTNNGDKIWVNYDPRGYALKLTEAATEQAYKAGIAIHRDWGGSGILAPEFDGKP